MKNRYNKEFNQFLNINKNFYRNKKTFKNNILIVSVTNSLIFNTVLLKFGKAISEIESANISFVPWLKPNNQINKLINSFKIHKKIYIIGEFVKLLFKYFFIILFEFFKIKNGQQLESYIINGIPIGKHIYDYILIRNKIPSLDKFSIRNKFDILLCLFYFLLVKDKISSLKINSILTLDNVYIEGIVFELCKYYKLKMYTGFDINLLTFHMYVNENDYSQHPRTPDNDYALRIFESNVFKNKRDVFLQKRFSGNQNQHDAKRAFSPNNIKLTRQELVSKYDLNDNKIVLVLPHIFCDAPHGYPSVFYQDYQYWLADTLKVLSKNKNINIIIKEHPSTELFSETGQLEELLIKLNLPNLKLISNNINARSLMNIVDTLVTCGGTSGMEYAYHGVPVIIASSPPYGNYNFINKANNINHYHELLSNCFQLEPLTAKQKELAGNMLFLFFEYYGIDKDKSKMNCYNVNIGQGNDLNHFFSVLSKEENLRKSHFVFVEEIKRMINNNNNNLYKNID